MSLLITDNSDRNPKIDVNDEIEKTVDIDAADKIEKLDGMTGENITNTMNEINKLDDTIFEKLLLLLHQIFTFVDFYYISFHGPVLEKLLRNEKFDNDILYMHSPGMSRENVKQLIMLLKKKYEHKMHIERNYTYNYLSLLSLKDNTKCAADCWEIVFELDINVKLTVIFHNKKLNDVLFNTENVCLDRFGLSVYDVNDNDIKKSKRKQIQSLLLLDSLRGISKNESRLIHSTNIDKIKNKNEAIFNLIHLQNKLIKNKKKITRGLVYVSDNTKECAICYQNTEQSIIYSLQCNHIFCYECIDKHVSCSYNKTCPICRQNIIFQFHSV